MGNFNFDIYFFKSIYFNVLETMAQTKISADHHFRSYDTLKST